MSVESQLSALLERWQQCLQAGRAVTPEEFCHDCPDLLEQFKKRIATPADLVSTPPSTVNASTAIGPAPPISIPGYEILEMLGRGGMGVVYKARQVRLKRLVALKMIRAGAHADDRDLRRFKAEAEAVARLQHPNIIQIHDIAEQNGLPFFAMEFADGDTLEKHFQDKPLAPHKAAAAVRTLAHAIEHAHSRGVIHRDLKPANVLRMADGTLKITDFGLAKILDEEQSLTPTTAFLGTPAYMAPEQAAGKAKLVGPATDIHALGAILYKLLTGRPPFLGEGVMETFDQIRFQQPRPPSSLRPEISADLDAICLKCLAKQPSDRYSSAAALADDLLRFQRHEIVSAAASHLAPRQPAPTPKATGVIAEVTGEAWWKEWLHEAGYELCQELAQEGPTIICKVRQFASGKYRLLEATTGTPSMAGQLARYAGRMRRLSLVVHPHLLQYFKVYCQQSRMAVLSELTSNDRPLQDLKENPFEPQDAAEVVAELASALDCVHGSGLIHRDVRPANIVQDVDGVLKLAGFGAAMCIDEPQEEDVLVFGLLNYMAPEQVDARTRDLGPRTDIYGLGALLYELLTSHVLFGETNPDETLRLVRHEPPSPPRSHRPDIPERLEAICLKCLQKDPSDRYPSALALAEELRRCAGSRSVWQRLRAWARPTRRHGR